MNFGSDNVAGVSPAVMNAIMEANQGAADPYGADSWTERLTARFRAVFETEELSVMPVSTGTAANALALSVLSPPYGAVLCHQESHIHVDECGAPEFFSGGAKLIPLEGVGAKLTPGAVESHLSLDWQGDVHHPQPAVLSITQSTELGMVYRPDEVTELSRSCHRHGLTLHMDGARLANAVSALGCSPADVTWRAGVDVLSFGATKNGCMAAEAVVFFGQSLPREAEFRRKRAGQLFSKMRFLSAQLEAYLADDLWLANAAHANAMARRLADGLEAVPGAVLTGVVEANEVFVRLPKPVADTLVAEGFGFVPWPAIGKGGCRFVTSWASDPADIDKLIAVARTADAAA